MLSSQDEEEGNLFEEDSSFNKLNNETSEDDQDIDREYKPKLEKSC